MTASSGASWTCPACSRRVPGHVEPVQMWPRAGAMPTRPTPAVPTQSHSVFMAKMAAAVLVAAAAMAGAAVLRPIDAGAGSRSRLRRESRARSCRPAIVARAVAEANRCAEPPDASPAPRTGDVDAEPPIVPAARQPAAPTPGAGVPLEDLVARVSPTVVVIETSTGSGSGVFVRPDTIVTNAHVAGSDLTVRVRRASGDTLRARVDTVARDLRPGAAQALGAAGRTTRGLARHRPRACGRARRWWPSDRRSASCRIR